MATHLTPDDHESILEEAVEGRRYRDIAKDRGLSVEAVQRIIDAATEEALSASQLRRDLFVEACRLREINKQFLSIALRDNDATAAAICIKASERLATLLGLNAPAAHNVNLHAAPSGPPQTSIDRIRGVFDNILHIGHRERELTDREDDLTPDERDELDALRAAREARKPQ